MTLEGVRKSVTTIVLSDRDILLRASNFGNLAAFRAIFMPPLLAHVDIIFLSCGFFFFYLLSLIGVVWL